MPSSPLRNTSRKSRPRQNPARPTAYPWQAWPNIGPFYPYPEVPLDWRAVTLRWDDGIW